MMNRRGANGKRDDIKTVTKQVKHAARVAFIESSLMGNGDRHTAEGHRPEVKPGLAACMWGAC